MNMSRKDVLKGRSIVNRNVFDTANQTIDEIKRNNPIVEYFKSRGVALTKKGNEYKGLCPFHDDKNPSLSVNESKQVFKCFGCGKAGTVIDAVSFYENVGTGEAIRILQGHSSPLAASGAAHEREEKEQNNDAAHDAEPGSAPNENSSLTTIADYYHKKLYQNPQAIEYLNKRGLENVQNYDRFKIGFADGSLLSVIGESQRHQLANIGILHDNGSEHFKNCVTVPIIDDLGQVVGMYGRNIEEPPKSPRGGLEANNAETPSGGGRRPGAHLYLKGKHRGVFHRKASKVYDEIILTESIIDALSLIELGVENVQSIYGTNGFTEEHLQILKDDRVKTVVLAFDSDEAGERASGALKEKLMMEGIGVKEIRPSMLAPAAADTSPPSGLRPSPPIEGGEKAVGGLKDWNEYLSSGGIAEPIKDAIAKAELYQAPDTAASSLSATKTPFGFDFTITSTPLSAGSEVTYSVSGVKEIFIGNLRARISARLSPPPGSACPERCPEPAEGRSRGEKYYDNLDLYSARSRAGFAANLAREFSLEQKRIEKDLVRILEYLERERDRSLLADSSREEAYVMTAQERARGMEFLTSPDLFDELVSDMDTLGYVGEKLNKQLLYIAASSRKLADPISVLVIAQSASGKSMLVDTVRALIPPEDVIAVTSLSDQALNYVADLEHKFLILSEAIHNEVVEHQLREMLSAKELSRLVTMKDQKTGELRTRLVKTRAIVATVMTSTRYEVNPENASRSFMIDADESKEQTRRIHERQRMKNTHERYDEKTKYVPRILEKHHAAQRLLVQRVIMNPFAKFLDFPDTLMRTRRDHDRFLDLIVAICFTRQFQKETLRRDDGVEYIECDLDDYRIAYEIMIQAVLSSTMNELPAGSVALYDELRTLARREARKAGIEPHEASLTQRDIREFTGRGQSWIKQQLRLLVDYEYVARARGGGARTKGHYRIRSDESIEALDFSMIPKPEEIERCMNEDQSKSEHEK